MASKSSLPLPRQNLIVLAICIVVVLVMALALLGPAASKKLALDQEIIAATDRLNILAQARQIQQQLDLHEERLTSRDLPAVPKPEVLTPEQSEHILGTLQELARRNEVEALAISPQLDGLDGESKSMRIEASFLGSLPRLHALVSEILLLPYVEDLHNLNFVAEQDTLLLHLVFLVRNEFPASRPAAPPEQGEPAS